MPSRSTSFLSNFHILVTISVDLAVALDEMMPCYISHAVAAFALFAFIAVAAACVMHLLKAWPFCKIPNCRVQALSIGAFRGTPDTRILIIMLIDLTVAVDLFI